jgi:hypothetical protein
VALVCAACCVGALASPAHARGGDPSDAPATVGELPPPAPLASSERRELDDDDVAPDGDETAARIASGASAAIGATVGGALGATAGAMVSVALMVPTFYPKPALLLAPVAGAGLGGALGAAIGAYPMSGVDGALFAGLLSALVVPIGGAVGFSAGGLLGLFATAGTVNAIPNGGLLVFLAGGAGATLGAVVGIGASSLLSAAMPAALTVDGE